jgi:hypothetical protein
MRLVPIYPDGKGLFASCYLCGQRIELTGETRADLDGPAFKAYYCHGCASIVGGKKEGEINV